MSIYRNRMVRMMGKDLFLPIKCYTPTKEQFYSLLGECKCMTECKFSREQKSHKDYQQPLDNGQQFYFRDGRFYTKRTL
jgi:hypothetical protein